MDNIKMFAYKIVIEIFKLLLLFIFLESVSLWLHRDFGFVNVNRLP